MHSVFIIVLLVMGWQTVFGQGIQVTLSQKHLRPNSLVNIHLEYPQDTYYGTWSIRSSDSCTKGKNAHDFSSEITIGDIQVSLDHQPKKLVWHIPANITTYKKEKVCIKVYHHNTNIAESGVYKIRALNGKKTKNFPEWAHMLFDPVEFYTGLQRESIEAEPKDKQIGIIGAGIAGLFSGFLLDSVGYHNYEIIEASGRVGGRMNTSYFGDPEEYRYQEMGAMRFPVSYYYRNKSMPIKDHQIVFQLAEELNKVNDEEHHIKFIKWVQHNENSLYYFDGIRLDNGKVPTRKDVSQNASLKLDLGPDGKLADGAVSQYMTDEWIDKMLQDVYSSHEEAIKNGYDDWTEWGYAHYYLKQSLNASMLLSPEENGDTVWNSMYLRLIMDSKRWKTVDQGLSRYPNAFIPLLGDKVQFNTKISKLDYHSNKVHVQWKSAPFDTTYNSKSYDRVIVAAPFSVVRTWHLPKLSFTIDKAIKYLRYSQACKVSLEFKTRFWEKGDRPIFGGCSSTDLVNGNFCYPSYKTGSEGPGVLLASYKTGGSTLQTASMPEKEHVALVLEDLAEIHGQQVRDEFTGNYSRYCGSLEQYTSGSWAEPAPGQHTLFMPSYFKTEKGLIFVGEHTDIKHAWVSAALHSAIRGAVMILVEAGHVDDARRLIQDWNITWMWI